MAKQRGPVASTFTGKVGNVVGAKLKGGEYVTRAYQPEVKNPNTLRQRVSRMRLATASELAAMFKTAVNMGYAAAAANTRMYPRNMFVAGLAKYSESGALQYENSKITVDYAKLELARKIGMSNQISASGLSSSDGNHIAMTLGGVTNLDGFAGEYVGVIVVCYNETKDIVEVQIRALQWANASEIDWRFNTIAVGDVCHVYAFIKEVPVSSNGVDESSSPWMYPSATSNCVYAGEVTIAQ